MSIFEGSAVALITPFDESGVDFLALDALIEWQIENKTDAIVVCGTTGEPSTMTEDEKIAVVERAKQVIAGRVPLIVGSGGNNTQAVISFSKKAEQLGADALLVVTPYYNKCSQKGLVMHYKAVADSVNIPIIMYNVPSRTGVNITPAALQELVGYKNIAAIKEASANITQITQMAKICAGKLDLYAGNDDHVVPILSVGGKGVVSASANILPRAFHDIVKYYLDGDLANAVKTQFYVNPMVELLFSDVSPIPIKTALNMMGKNAGLLRMPLCEMSDSSKLEAALRQYKLI